jgi:hypothetical protein
MAKPWSSVAFQLPSSIPTMITAEERRYLHWLGRDFWTARGEVVEIGPWLGGSTYALASGMAARGAKAHRRLHVFDSFTWRPFMSQRAPLPLSAGDDFQPYFERNLEPYRDLLVVERKSIPDDRQTSEALTAIAYREEVAEGDRLRWNGGPIEILFVDGAKSWGGFVYLLKEMAASLVPGLTLLVCQDYKHWGSYWVPAIVELLYEHLEPTHVLEKNTVAFSCTKAIDPDDLVRLVDYEALSVGAGAAVLERAACRLESRADPEGAVMLRLTKSRYLGQRGAHAEAIEQFRVAERAAVPRHHARAVEDTRLWLETLFGTRLAPTRWFRVRADSYKVYSFGRRLYMRTRSMVASQRASRRAP